MFEEREYCNETFTGLDFSEQCLEAVVFENCIFNDVDFHDVTLKQCQFIDCEFNNANLSNITLGYSKFNDVCFRACKVIGIDWSKAAWPTFSMPANIHFYDCIANDASFAGLDLSELVMEQCKLHDVDFRETNLSQANFRYSDFSHALFHRSNLSEADFTEAVNYHIDVLNNQLKGAMFSRFEAVNLLSGLGIELID